MKRKIIGVTVGSPLPKPNLMQTDPTKGDYVKGKEDFLKQVVAQGSGGGLSITDDDNGNVTIASTGSVKITDDGDGNVMIV